MLIQIPPTDILSSGFGDSQQTVSKKISAEIELKPIQVGVQKSLDNVVKAALAAAATTVATTVATSVLMNKPLQDVFALLNT